MKLIRVPFLLVTSSVVSALNTFVPKPITTQRLPPSLLRSTSTAFSIDTSLIDTSYATAANVETFFPVQAVPIAIDKNQQQQQQQFPCTITELLGEALGTGWIVGAGILASSSTMDPSLVCSTAVTIAIYMTSSVLKWGNAHFNPAITLAMALFRQMDWHKVIPYSLAQVVGSMTGSYASTSYNTLLMADTSTMSMETGAEYLLDDVNSNSFLSVAQAFGFEALGTAVLTAMAFAMTHPSRQQSQQQLPVAVMMGATVFSLAPLAVGMNPARDLGPRVVAFAAGTNVASFQDCWVYMLAPLVGAALGAAFVDKVAFATSFASTTADNNKREPEGIESSPSGLGRIE